MRTDRSRWPYYLGWLLLTAAVTSLGWSPPLWAGLGARDLLLLGLVFATLVLFAAPGWALVRTSRDDSDSGFRWFGGKGGTPGLMGPDE